MQDNLHLNQQDGELLSEEVFVREAGAAGPRAREQWPSRMAYVLAAMGGAVGVGNLLRYPSQAAAHAGVQWFIPYLLALFVVGIPLLLLEISLGQAYQGGAVVAYNGLNCRLRGLGLGHSFIAFVTDTYYIAIMAYVLVYFRHSFRAPIPWAADNRAFFANEVHRAVDPVENATTGWISYPGTAVVGETLGWEILTWILVYLSIFRGVAITGKVVYLTMLLPLVMCIVLLVRSVTLSDARAGILQYIGKWNGASLRSGKIWSAAIRQIFFSIGTGFGYFIAYASFVNIHSNAVQDALIIALSNCLIEVIMGFAAFAVIGHLAIDLKKNPPSTFDIGFIAYPTAIAKMPGANVWAVFFFIIIYLLAIDSAFALAESFVTVVTDSDWGSRLHKPVAVAICLFVAFLCSIPYCTQFGLYLLDAVDKWITGITLMFGSWLQCSVITSVYRYKDVLSQTGMPAFAIAQGAYFASMILGVILWQTVGPAAGGGMFVSLLVVGTVIATLMSKKPEVAGAWGSNKFVNSFWWLTNYSGYQLGLDLNAVVGKGKNWNIPPFWAPLLRWVTAPLLIAILSVEYAEFAEKTKHPLHIFAFVVAHIGVGVIVLGFLAPPAFAFLVPGEQRTRDQDQYKASPGQALPTSEEAACHDSVEDSTV